MFNTYILNVSENAIIILLFVLILPICLCTKVINILTNDTCTMVSASLHNNIIMHTPYSEVQKADRNMHNLMPLTNTKHIYIHRLHTY